jgi:hypothetical protein
MLEETMTRRLLPGEGATDWDELAQVFGEIGARPIIAPEPFNAARARARPDGLRARDRRGDPATSRRLTGEVLVADDLFASAARDELSRRAPLAARMRPTTLDEIVGKTICWVPGKPLRY